LKKPRILGSDALERLDRAPKGRNEAGYWWRHHDEYSKG
jgi:predicted dithiol-disulfide oxidoreductase (DUF899 family)